MIRCKFVCEQITKMDQGTKGQPRILHAVQMRPVHSGSEENKQFFAYTPSGKLELYATNEQPFEPGKEYYLDITPAE